MKKKLIRDHLQTRVPTLPPSTTVDEARRLIIAAQKPWDSVNYVYVLNDHDILVGVVSIKELLAASPAATLESVMHRQPISVHAMMHEERAPELAIAHSLKALPVVDRDQRFLGVVPSDAILSILHRKHTEHFLRSAGFADPHLHLLDVMKMRMTSLFRARFWWLFAGLVGGMIAASVAGLFEGVLRQEILLAFFIPVVLYFSAAVGTQTQTLFIRSLALARISLPRYLWREVKVGIILGVVFGFLAYGIVVLVWQNELAARVLALTFLLTITMATVVAICISWLFFRFHRDPAVGSGPFATILQDLLSLIIYFFVASILL